MSVAGTDREREIADLYESGLRTSEIAQKLGLSTRYVGLVVFRLGLDDDGTDRGHRAAMANFSQTLLAALQREGFA